MHSRAAVLLLLLLPVCAYGALGPGAEVPVSAPTIGPLPGRHYIRAVATDGTDFLTVWNDETPGRAGYYATVVRADGTRRLALPLRIFGESPAAAVAAVWTGSSYLVAVTPYLESTTLLRLDRDGQPIAEPRTIDVGGFVWQLTWNGQRVLAITIGSPVLGAAILDAEGNVSRTGISLLGTGTSTVTVEAVDGAFVVMWAETLPVEPGVVAAKTRVSAVRVSSAGDVSAPVELMEPAYGSYVISSASNGHEAALAVKRSWTETSLLRYTIDASLHVHADPAVTLEPYVFGIIEAIATSRGFVAAYVNSRATELKLRPFGSTATEIVPVPAGSYNMRFESNGEALLAFWDTLPATATAFNRSLTSAVSSRFPIAFAPVQQGSPVLATAGNTGLVAWNENSALKAQFIDRDGQRVGSEITITTSATSRAAVGFTGETWLVAYSQEKEPLSSTKKVQRISPAGELLGAPIDLDVWGGDVVFATNGNVTAMVMEDGFRRNWIRIVRFSRSGEPIDPTPITLTDQRSEDNPAIASNGHGFLVVWNQSPGPRLVGKRLDASANPMDAAPFEIATTLGFGHSAAKVASDGDDYVVAYVQYGEYVIHDPPFPDDPRPAPSRVFTKRVLAAGVLADVTADQEGTLLGFGTFPAIVHDGNRYVLTFRKDLTDTQWLFVTSLDATGAPMYAPRQVVRAESYALDHDLASIGGTLWAAYSRVVSELEGVHRVFLRELTEQTGRRRGSRSAAAPSRRSGTKAATASPHS